MPVLVVYESVFGNTRRVAERVAESLQAFGDVTVKAVDAVEASDLTDVDLLLVGAPTHAWSLPRRRGWPTAAAPAPRTLAREWLSGLPEGGGRPCAVFATRLDKSPLITGSAAGGLGRRLRRRGWSLVVEPKSFVVRSTEGPISPEELDAAAGWAGDVAAAAKLAARSPGMAH